MAKKKEILYHVIFWVLFIGMDQLLEAVTHQNQNPFFWTSLQSFAFTFLHFIIFYLNYSLICPKTIPYKKWKLFAVAQFLLILLFPALRYFGEEVMIYNITGMHNYSLDSRNFIYYIYDNSYYVVRIILFSVVFYFIKYSWNTNRQVTQLQLEKKQAELQVLKNQLSPHFLFNTLNSFYADLYDTQPKVANDILKLSEMLRYVTYENENDMVLLKDEIEFVQHYIDLLKRRFDDTISVTFLYPETSLAYRIPSLLLIHFVENAFKHGVLQDEATPVVINLTTENNQLNFSVTNSFEKSEHYDEPGIGHKNIRQRLALLYPDNHELKIIEHEKTYHITLKIPLQQ